jgi:hypothetical protein
MAAVAALVISTVLSFREGICFSPLAAQIDPRRVIAPFYTAFASFL